MYPHPFAKNIVLIVSLVCVLFVSGYSTAFAQTGDTQPKPEQDLFYINDRITEQDKYVLGLKIDSRNTDDYEKIVEQITQKSETAYEKARAIFTWMAVNVAYDKNLKITNADETFRQRKGVCMGYAGLYKKFADIAGLDVVAIGGIAKTTGEYKKDKPDQYFPGPHIWNAVKADDGHWILIDATWGAEREIGSERINYSWFDTNPSMFALSHFPDDAEWQLISEPLTKEEFEVYPRLYAVITLMGLKGEDLLAHFRNDKAHSFPYMYFSNEKIGINEMPFSRTLSSKQGYTFSFTLPDNLELALLQNENDWITIDVENNVWSITHMPVKGELTVLLKKEGVEGYDVLFIYTVK